MKTNIRRALIVAFGTILPMCAIIMILWPQGNSAATESATEDFCCFCPSTGIRWENIIPAFMFLFMAIYSLEFIIERWFKFATARKQTRAFQSEVAEAIYRDRIEEAIYISTGYKNSPLAFVTAASLKGNCFSQIENEAIKPSMHERQRAIVIKSADIKRRLWTLAAIGWSAPIAGFIFALINILQAVLNIRDVGGSGIYILAGQLTSATFHMLFGSVIAVLAICAHKYFASQVETFALEMDKLSLAIIGQITDHQQRSFQQETANHFITHSLDARQTRRLAD